MRFKTAIGIVKLSVARKKHIILRHPLMEDYLVHLKEVLETPSQIKFSSRSEDVLLFYRFFDKIEEGKYIAVVVDKIEKSVLTAYLTHRIKAGKKYAEDE